MLVTISSLVHVEIDDVESVSRAELVIVVSLIALLVEEVVFKLEAVVILVELIAGGIGGVDRVVVLFCHESGYGPTAVLVIIYVVSSVVEVVVVLPAGILTPTMTVTVTVATPSAEVDEIPSPPP